ncbi:MAG TPA: efflux RND transporter periplasmic adaptor subunit [Nitrospirota bacterium]|nr:efflux RND transporter periplasmic adaptor subunit [Nitrospirota bacterium]
MKKKKIGLITASAVIVIAIVVFVAYSRASNDRSETAVATAVVEKRDMGSLVQATGIIKPKVGAEVKVGARITGKVEHLYANIGDRVKKGQVLVRLEQDDLKARADQAEAAYLEAAAAFDKAKIDLERDKPLAQQGYISQQNIDVLQNAYDMTKARLLKAKADQDYAKAQLSYATITAPISGTIASVTTQQGETVAAGLNAPTFITIIDLNKLEVNAYVDETDVGKIGVGQETLFTVDTFADKDFKGRVTAIYPRAVLQENVVNYITLISIENSEGKLKPDMTANVTITLKTKKGVLAIPGAAVTRESGKKYVMLQAKDGKAARHEVKTGWKEGTYVEITSGLKEGDIVVTGTNK